MDFNFSDEQNMLRDTVSKFVDKEYEFERRRHIVEDIDALKSVWANLVELGLPAASIDEQFDGFGGGAVENMIIMEQFGRGLVTAPFLQTAVMGAKFLSLAGSGQQKQHYLGGIVNGETVCAFAYAEPQGRFNLANLATSAVNNGSTYTLDGHKAVVIAAPLASHFIVTARTSGNRCDAMGISLFIVPADAEGVVIRRYHTVDGFTAAEVYFNQVVLTGEHLLGTEGHALALVERVVDEAVVALCAEGCGVLSAMYELTLDYAKSRKQFGRPLSDFQTLSHRLVDMFIQIEKALSTTYMATLHLNGSPDQRALATSAAKVTVGSACRFVGQSAIQIYGGMGMSDEVSVGHYFKRATMIESQFGDCDYHLKRYTNISQVTTQRV